MKRLLYFISICSVVLASCNGILDVTPKDFLSPDQYYSTEKELETALSGVYATLLKSGTYLNNLGRMGLDADEAWNHREVGSVANYAQSPNDEKIEAFWRDFYAGISRANMLLQNVEKPTDISEEKRNVIKGEALFLRSFFYFMLVSNFGDIPLVLKTIETADLDELRPKKTDAKLVYEQIIRDLEEAAELVLPIEETKSGGRANKSAVYGLLARVNLYMAGYPLNEGKLRFEEVVKWTDKIIQNPTHKLNPSFQNVFEKLARDEYGFEEVLFEIEFTGNGTGIYATLGGFVGVNNGIQNNSNSVDGLAHSYLMSTYYTYHVFGSGDLRRDWSIAPFTYEANGTYNYNYIATRYFQRYIGKFRRISETLTPKHQSRTPQNYPIIRFSDILLMRAEAENEVNLGPGSDPNSMAYRCINMVRRRGYGLDYTQPQVDVDLKDHSYGSFFQQIQEERTRELAFENMRKADLVRWGKDTFIDKMKEGYNHSLVAPSWSALPRAQEYFLNAQSSDRHVLWPIPSSEIGVNPKLTQNSGY